MFELVKTLREVLEVLKEIAETLKNNKGGNKK